MKKPWLVGITIAATLLGGAFVVSAANNANTESPRKMEMLTFEEAKTLALEKFSGKIDSIELEKNKNGVYYEVEVKTDHSEVELHIEAYTGEILHLEQDDDDGMITKSEKTFTVRSQQKETNKNANKNVDTNKKNDDQSVDFDSVNLPKQDVQPDNNKEKKDDLEKKTPKQAIPSTYISIEEAKTIAIKNTNGKVVEVEKERENGQLVYEIELVTSTHEIEVKINAATGEIIKTDYDRNDDDDDDN